MVQLTRSIMAFGVENLKRANRNKVSVWLLIAAIVVPGLSMPGEIVIPPETAPSSFQNIPVPMPAGIALPDYINRMGAQIQGREILAPLDVQSINSKSEEDLKRREKKDSSIELECLPGEHSVDGFDPETLSDIKFCSADPYDFEDHEFEQADKTESSEVNSDIHCLPQEVRTETMDTVGLRFIVTCVPIESIEVDLTPSDEASCLLESNPFDLESAASCTPFAFGLSDTLAQDLKRAESEQKKDEEETSGGYLAPFSADQSLFEDDADEKK